MNLSTMIFLQMFVAILTMVLVICLMKLSLSGICQKHRSPESEGVVAREAVHMEA